MDELAAVPLEAVGLRRVYPGGDGVLGIDLAVKPGQVHALVGLNGAGKSTLLRMLIGMTRPDAGSVTIFGQPVAQAGPDIWRHVGHLVEGAPNYPDLTVAENLDSVARLRGMDRQERAAAVASTMLRFAIDRYASRRTARLSAGNRQRLALAACLLHRPRLVILDEPTLALDPLGVVLLREVLQQLVDAGGTVIVSSHHLDEVARLADRISVIDAGRVIGTLDPETPDIERAFFAMVVARAEAAR